MSQKPTDDPGLGRTGTDPSPLSDVRADAPRDDRQTIDGGRNDDLAARSEQEAFIRAARSTPSMADVRSDDQGVPNGEPR